MRLGRILLALCVISVTGMSCAATSDTPHNRHDAILLNADRSDIREAIRIFVRQDAGRFVIADPDSLVRSPEMVVSRRARDFERQSRTLPSANRKYRLLSDGANCWLIRHESGPDSPIAIELLLPESAQCMIYSKNDG